MEYWIVIEYVRGADNSIADVLSRLDSVVVDKDMPLISQKMSRPSPALPHKLMVWKLETDRLTVQRAAGTISFVADLLRRHARPELANIEMNPELKRFGDVWPLFALKDVLVKHCNERAVSNRVVVPSPL